MEQVGVCCYVDSPAEWWALTPSWEGRTSVKETKSINFSLSLSGKGFGRSTQGPIRSLIRGRPSCFLCWKVWDRPQTGSLPWAARSKACGLGSVRWKTRASACVCTRWVCEYSFQKIIRVHITSWETTDERWLADRSKRIRELDDVLVGVGDWCLWKEAHLISTRILSI